MKREYRNAIKRGIEKSDTNGYKWSTTPNGLKWSYLDIEFTFIVEDGGEFLNVIDNFGHQFVLICYGHGKYGDCQSLEEAYEIATRRLINRANYTY